MKHHHFQFVRVFLLFAILLGGSLSFEAQASVNGETTASDNRQLGSGDGRIHVIPAISAPSVKNGGKLTIQAVVKAQAGVAKVEAIIDGVTRLELRPAGSSRGTGILPVIGGMPAFGSVQNHGQDAHATMNGPSLGNALPAPNGSVSLYQADWTAQNLQEKVYPVTLRVTDLVGHVYEDHSLAFSDPAAGNSTVGSTAYPASTVPRRVGALALQRGEDYISCAAIDPIGGYAYFGTQGPYNGSGNVIKIRLSDFTLAGSLKLSNADFLHTAVIDPEGGYAYFNSDARLFKVRLSDFTVVGNLPLDNSVTAVIDPVHGYAYWGMWRLPGTIIKIRLSDFSYVGTLTLDNGDGNLQCATIDPAGGYLYLGMDIRDGGPGKIVKVRLSDFTRVGALALPASEKLLFRAGIDTLNGYAYFTTGDWGLPGTMVKVRLSDFTRAGTLTLNAGEMIVSLVIDAANGYAFCGTLNSVVKIRLSDFKRVDALTFTSLDESTLQNVTYDPYTGYAYFGTYTPSPKVVKVACSCKNALRANRLTLSERAIVRDLCFYSHAAKGNLRLAIYSDTTTKTLIWQSAATTNTKANDWVTIPITSGNPPNLTLAPGKYWLAWQTDSNADVPSYAPGTAGEGFVVDRPFGAFPARLGPAEITATSEKWSEYLIYDSQTGAIQWRMYP